MLGPGIEASSSTAAMCASIFNVLPVNLNDRGGAGPIYVLLIFLKEIVDHAVHVLHIAIVDRIPYSTYDAADFEGISGVSSLGLTWCGCWPLYGLQWFGHLLLEVSIDGLLYSGALELGCSMMGAVLLKLLLKAV